MQAASTNPTTRSGSVRTRIDAVDVLRGIIMVLMALDHVRDFFGDLAVSPTNLATTTPALFFTRWVTHFCAPVFFLLTGAGARLALSRRTRAELSRFLLTRGLWIVVLECTVARFLWQFNLDYHLLLVNVLWALGWSMIVLGVLVHLPPSVVGAIGVAMIAMHNLLDRVQPASFGSLAPVWNILHVPGIIRPAAPTVFISYVLVPWIGVTAAGYALGGIYAWEPARRRAFLVRTGAALVAAFIVIRSTNLYGDPSRWSVQPTGTFTLLSFLNTSKYPPSLLYLLMTLGPALLALRLFDRGTPAWLRPARIIGAVPMFYYLGHIAVAHLFTVVLSLARYGTARPMMESPTLDRFPITQPPGWPLSLPAIYGVWMLVVVVLYPACRWYAGVKRRSRSPWLSYL